MHYPISARAALSRRHLFSAAMVLLQAASISAQAPVARARKPSAAPGLDYRGLRLRLTEAEFLSRLASPVIEYDSTCFSGRVRAGCDGVAFLKPDSTKVKLAYAVERDTVTQFRLVIPAGTHSHRSALAAFTAKWGKPTGRSGWWPGRPAASPADYDVATWTRGPDQGNVALYEAIGDWPRRILVIVTDMTGIQREFDRERDPKRIAP